jgi:hypothetical protein
VRRRREGGESDISHAGFGLPSPHERHIGNSLGCQMDRTDKLKADLAHAGWDFSDPAVCVMFDRAHQIVSPKVVEYGTPDAATRGGAMGTREHYPRAIFENSREEHLAYVAEMRRLGIWDKDQDETQDDVARRVAIFRQVGIKRGYDRQNSMHDTRRFSFVENHRPQYMESFTDTGERKLMPVYGGGQGQDVGGSKYAHLASMPDDSPIVYGGGRTEEESRFKDVPEPPRLRNGEIDYEALNRMNGHEPMRGRKNVTIPRG